VLVKCKWQGTNGKDVNVSWYRNEGPGRVFYTDFAKVDTDLSNTTIGPHIIGGLSAARRRFADRHTHCLVLASWRLVSWTIRV